MWEPLVPGELLLSRSPTRGSASRSSVASISRKRPRVPDSIHRHEGTSRSGVTSRPSLATFSRVVVCTRARFYWAIAKRSQKRQSYSPLLAVRYLLAEESRRQRQCDRRLPATDL